jgi:hypothetical protein
MFRRYLREKSYEDSVWIYSTSDRRNFIVVEDPVVVDGPVVAEEELDEEGLRRVHWIIPSAGRISNRIGWKDSFFFGFELERIEKQVEKICD